jgi:hypothetical protein
MPSTNPMHGFVSHRRFATGQASFIRGLWSNRGRHSNAHRLGHESLRVRFTDDVRRRTRTRRKAWDRRSGVQGLWEVTLRDCDRSRQPLVSAGPPIGSLEHVSAMTSCRVVGAATIAYSVSEAHASVVVPAPPGVLANHGQARCQLCEWPASVGPQGPATLLGDDGEFSTVATAPLAVASEPSA